MSENIDRFDSYFEAIEQREQLESLLPLASDNLRPTIENGLFAVNTAIDELEADGVALDIAHYGEEIENDLAVLEALRATIDKRYISTETVDSQIEVLLSDERKMKALALFRELKVLEAAGITKEFLPQAEELSETITTNDEPLELPTTNIEPEVELPSDMSDRSRTLDILPAVDGPKIQIEFKSDGIQIGEKGRFIRFSNTAHNEQRDYGDERRAILKVLVENAGSGEYIKVHELWKMAFGDDKEFDRSAMTQIKLWLSSITFRREPIVSHNGRRRGSAYGIANKNITIKEDTGSDAEIFEEDKEVKLSSPVSLQAHLAKEDDPTMIVVDEEVLHSALKFPLNHAETTILLQHILTRKDILKSIGVEDLILPEGKAEEILGIKDIDKKLLMGVIEHGGSLEKARESIAKKLVDYFEKLEQSQVDELLAEMSGDDFRIDLVCFLYDLKTNDKLRVFLDYFLTTKPFVETRVDSGSFSRGLQIAEIRAGFVDRDGNVIPNFPHPDSEQDIQDSTPDAKESEGVGIETLTKDEVVSLNGENEPELVAMEPDEPAKEKAKPVDPDLLKIEKDAREAIHHLIEDGVIVDKLSKISRDIFMKKSSSRSNGTDECIKRASDNGIIKRESLTHFSVRQVVAMDIQNSNSGIFQMPNNSKKFKEALKIIDRLITEIFSELEKNG